MLEKEKYHRFGGGPLGLGDPEDRRLRAVEKDLIIGKMVKEEAQKKCNETLQVFLSCAKEAGLKVAFKCQAENDKNNECLLKWLKNPHFIEEVTNKYLEARSHYRRTGEPLHKYVIKKKEKSGFC